MMTVRYSPDRIRSILLFVVASLVAMSLLGQFSRYYLGHGHVFGLVSLFSLDTEANVPSWYSSVALLASSVLLGVIAFAKRGLRDRWWKHWAGLTVIFLYVAVDEAAAIHELTITPMRELFGATGMLHWAWVIPGMIVVAGLALIYLSFLLSLDKQVRNRFVLAAVLFLGGALGVEMLGAAWFVEYGRRNMGYVLFWTAEEALEMLGVVVFIHALLSYIAQQVGDITVTDARVTPLSHPKSGISS